MTGNIKQSQVFDVRRDVVQGDIIRSILFIVILSLDQMVQESDIRGQGVNVDEIKDLRVLGYVDDLAMINLTTEEMTTRLTAFTDEALSRTDMMTKLAKTRTHHVRQQNRQQSASTKEIVEKEASYNHPCLIEQDVCTA